MTFDLFWRPLELGNVLVLSQLHETILVLWSQCRAPPPWWTLVHRRVSPFLFDLLLQFIYASTRNFGWIWIHPRVSPFLLSAWCPRDQTRNISRSLGSILVHPRVSPVWIIGFLALVGFVGCLCCFQRLLNPILSSNSLRRKLVVVEVIHIFTLVWLLQIPSQQLSRYNKLGVCHKGWFHYILFDRTSIILVEQAVYRPNTPYPGVFSTSSACTMQDVVRSSQAHADLCDLWPWDSQP